MYHTIIMENIRNFKVMAIIQFLINEIVFLTYFILGGNFGDFFIPMHDSRWSEDCFRLIYKLQIHDGRENKIFKTNEMDQRYSR